ncbi:pyridoxamine 5'-phosphate oxidase family protein [Tepidibacter hydrothermalis]|uniref:Pyridoxamine 5'-phosphate oxidase family protein n=1 Tax=Tepidibacter hydrothermalis TaxID=3036126 RepID=A0ABY8EL07_9FIRM|nr:pyridoxamine 5'-phosphate oxidase family protein [Tepidibacter hydrothermalis]WFD11908.1 pyridoxamine 5'-phosphate oxidase family protein [Tepidibacter hydrothermalis]
MSKELNFIKENPMGFLATTDENGKPRVRGFGIMITEDNRIFFGTSNKRRTFKQLKVNPYAEWIAKSKNSSTLRVSGHVVIEEDIQIKLNTIENNPVIKNIYAGREEEFEMFYLENVEYDWFEMKMTIPMK